MGEGDAGMGEGGGGGAGRRGVGGWGGRGGNWMETGIGSSDVSWTCVQ